MESLGDILGRTPLPERSEGLGLDLTADEEDKRRRLERLAGLRNTAEYGLRLKNATKVLMDSQELATKYPREQYPGFPGKRLEDAQRDFDRAEREFADAEERDRIQAARPEGCWCLGAGGRDSASMEGDDHQRHFVWATVCSACDEGKAEAERKAILRSQEQHIRLGQQVARHWQHAEIPPRWMGLRLATHPLGSTNATLLSRLKAPSDTEDSTHVWAHESWYFWGSFGTGKTGLAVGHAWERLNVRPHTTVLFRSMPDLLSELRSSYGKGDGPSETDLIRRYTGAGLLILDDIGAEQVTGSGWVEDRLYQIIGKRHAEEQPVIFTSNLNLEDLSAKIGDRVAWRIVEMCGKENIVEVKGPNLRQRPAKGIL